MTAAPPQEHQIELPLRPYQKEALRAIWNKNRDDGVKRQLVVLPTGTGKTVVFSYLIKYRKGRTLVLAHREELLQQTKQKILKVDPWAHVGIVKAGRNESYTTIVVASVQTLCRPNRLKQFSPDDFDTIIIDEAHHAAADTYLRILEFFNAFDQSGNGPLVVGFTATPERGDRIGLNLAFQEITYQREILEMIVAGYLCDMRAVAVHLDADWDGLKTRNGDFSDADLGRLLQSANAATYIVNAYEQHAIGRKTICFTPLVEIAHEVAEAFRLAGHKAEALDGTTPEKLRKAILERLASGETRIVVNCGVLTEGFDDPEVSCVIVARPTKSRPLYVQMVGRGTRLYPGKDDCMVIDLVGSTSRHKLQTASSLFGLKEKKLGEPSKSTLETLDEEQRGSRLEQRSMDAMLGGKLVSAEVDLFARAKFEWIVSGRSWVLNISGGWLALVPVGTGWDVHVKRSGKQRQTIARDLDLGYAQGFAEDFIRREDDGVSVLLNARDARWRSDPATEKQIEILTRKGIDFAMGLSKGEASALITAHLARRGH